MWLLAYVTNIFGKLNKVNESLEENKNVMQRNYPIGGFRGKRAYWRESISKAAFAPFPQMCQLIEDECSTKEICSHLKGLEEHFHTYFTEVEMLKVDWVKDLFHCNAGAVDLPSTTDEQPVEFPHDKDYHQGLDSQEAVEDFWFGG